MRDQRWFSAVLRYPLVEHRLEQALHRHAQTGSGDLEAPMEFFTDVEVQVSRADGSLSAEVLNRGCVGFRCTELAR